MPLGRSDTSLQDLIQAGLLDPGETLWFRGSETKATLNADGTIRLAGRTFSSPTAAANSLLTTNANGWTAWRVGRHGESVTLAAIRQEYRNSR